MAAADGVCSMMKSASIDAAAAPALCVVAFGDLTDRDGTSIAIASGSALEPFVPADSPARCDEAGPSNPSKSSPPTTAAVASMAVATPPCA